MKPKWRVLCYGCSLEMSITEEMHFGGIMEQGRIVGRLPSDDCVLVCPDWADRNQAVDSTKSSCDDCGRVIAVGSKNLRVVRMV